MQRGGRDFGEVVILATGHRSVRGEMLGTGGDAGGVAKVIALETADACLRQLHAQIRVLAGAFRDPSPALVTRDVDHRREGPVDAECGGLERRRAGGAFGKVGIERAGLGDRQRIGGAQAVNDVTREDQRDLEPGRERRILRGLGTGIADTVEEHADLPGLDPRDLFGGTAGRETGVERHADRADLIGEATELARFLSGRHLGDQALDPVALRERRGRAERQASNGRAAGQQLTAV